MINSTTPAPGRILIADDDASFRLPLAEVLRRTGFICECASNGPDALNLLSAGGFDALLADVQMAGNHNLELVAEAHRITPDLPIILLTGFPCLAAASRSVRLPVMAYLAKPPDLNEVEALLTQAVSDHRFRRLTRANRQRLQQWDKDLQHIEWHFRKPGAPQTLEHQARFAALMFQNLILTLIDLERSVASLCQHSGPDSVRTAEILGALRTAATTLAKTKQNFKSRDLGQLRAQLENLLARSSSEADQPSSPLS